MTEQVQALFARYADLFNRSLVGDVPPGDVAALYATEFIGAGPGGVMAGRNDDGFAQVIAQGFAQYRAIGTRRMQIRDLRITPLDAAHCVAHVAWTATYARDGGDDIAIDFDVHYFVQILRGDARVFGWVAGDEQAALRAHGVI